MKKIYLLLLLVNLFCLSCVKIPSETILVNPPSKPLVSEKKIDPIPKGKPPTIPSEKLQIPIIPEKTDSLSHEKLGWGLSVTTNETSPGIPDSWKKLLKKYNGFYLGSTDKKIVYLTFDCGYEAGFTSKIIDILKQNHVPAIFFIVGHYINTKPDLVKKMVDNGFQIGNHTSNHPDLSILSEQEIKKEVGDFSIQIKKLTGLEPIYFRPPSGVFSEFSLAIIKNLGFKTIFWSLAYRDWIPLPGGAEESYQTVMNRIHPGAIILMHTVTKDNQDALQRIIDSVRAKGYEFASIDF
jgi:peptidoglycan-N-acetylmuramic acid deacetylase